MVSASGELVVHHLFNSDFFRGSWKPALELPGCRVTSHPSSLMTADILLVHLPSILTTNTAESLVSLRGIVPGRQVWVAESLESAGNFPSLDDRAFMAIFDLEASYRQSADIWMPYIPLEFSATCARRFALPRRPHCCAFVSSNWDQSGRQSYMRDLAHHFRIDSYGRFMRNAKLWRDRGIRSKLNAMKRYRFTLAFENSIAEDYVTEKFFEPLLAGSIPVYMGAPNIAEFAPGENSFINVADFDTPADLARFLASVDPADYQAWRRKPLKRTFMDKLARTEVPTAQRFAAALSRCAQDRD
jgi:hypothetical protein